MKIDTLFYGGTVHTMVGEIAQAVAVSDGRIASVGSDQELLPLVSDGTVLENLSGGHLLPGFNDSHCHLLLTGQMRRALDLRGVTSHEEIIARGREYIAVHKPLKGTWITGYGFDHNQFSNPILPTRETGDAISTEHPILLDRVCGHVGALNSLAIKEMGLDEHTVIEGGILDKGASGELNGILREAALDTCKMRIPMPDVTAVKEIILEMSRAVNAMGITSVQSDDLWAAPLDTVLTAFSELESEGLCTVRVYEEVQAPRMPELRKFLARNLRTGDGSSYFTIGNIKLLTDGSLGARTAYLLQPYQDDSGNTGVPVYTQQALDEIVETANSAGMQIAFHAIGDGALSQCVSAVERAQKIAANNLRHRIVHCQIGNPELYRRMKAAGMCADIQPAFVHSDAQLVSSRLGTERTKNSYAWKTLLDMEIYLGGGSDSPVETFDPLWGIYCAVTRKEASGAYPDGFLPEQKLTVKEAVRLYTYGSAYVSFSEHQTGTVECGKYADFVVLKQDIFSVPHEDIPHIPISMTISGGKVCYRL